MTDGFISMADNFMGKCVHQTGYNTQSLGPGYDRYRFPDGNHMFSSSFPVVNLEMRVFQDYKMN